MDMEKNINTVKESIQAVLDLEIELIRKGVATRSVRRGLNDAVVDLGTYLVSANPAEIIWFLQKGDEHGRNIKAAVEAGMASLTAEEAEAFAKFVAENPNAL